MTRLVFLFVLLFLTICLVQSPVYAGKKSYTMICQGGGGMTADFDRKVRWDKPDLFTTRIYFKKSNKAAGEQKPTAGQCAWFDRPLSKEEPSVLVFERKKKNPINHLKISKGKIKLISATKEEMDLIKAIYDGKQFILQARRDKDVLKITKVGP